MTKPKIVKQPLSSLFKATGTNYSDIGEKKGRLSMSISKKERKNNAGTVNLITDLSDEGELHPVMAGVAMT